MEAESSQEMPEESESTTTFTLCHRCQQDSSLKSPKLFTCLHNFCSDCLDSLKSTTSADKYVCCVCQQETATASAIDNKFIADTVSRMQASNQTVEDHICQGCEENVTASSFCTDCRDWLCDQCVFAHRRVRVTKDHSIQAKENVRDTEDPKAKVEYCSTHPNETLVFFCPSCDTLTCRDCQLLKHLKHDFRSVSQATDKHKSWLLQMADKLQQDVTTMEETQSLIRRKIDEVSEKEQIESDKIKQFAIIFITEINRRGRAMLEDLKALCASQRAVLEHRNSQLESILDRYRYTIQFTEEIIRHATNASLLQTRSLVGNQIIKVHGKKIQSFDPRYRFDVAFGFSPQVVKDMMPKMCHLTLNGQPYAGEYMRKRYAQQQPSSSGTTVPLSAAAADTELSGAAPNVVSKSGFVSTSATSVQSTQTVTSRAPAPGTSDIGPTSHANAGSSHISSSTGGPTSSSPQRPDSATISVGSDLGSDTSQSRPANNDSASSHLDPKTFSFDSDPKKFLNVKVKQEKKDDGFETDKTNSCAAKGTSVVQQAEANVDTTSDSKREPENLTGNSTDPSSGPSPLTPTRPQVDDGSHTPPHGTGAPGPFTASPTIARFGTVLSLPEYGLEAESRTVYIPASAPCPGPPTPRKQDSHDPNEDWCAVCHDGGELLCCGRCPKVFHYKCHVPEITAEPGEDWQCGLCVDEAEIHLASEPSRYIMVNGERKRKAPMGLLSTEIKACERILLELFCHPNSVPFHEPVPKSTPLYHQIIKTPMDFKTVYTKLQPRHFNHYKSLQEFIDDVCLVFANCKKYNKIGSEVREWGVIVESYFMEVLQRILPFIHFVSPEDSSQRESSPKRQCTDTETTVDT